MKIKRLARDIFWRAVVPFCVQLLPHLIGAYSPAARCMSPLLMI